MRELKIYKPFPNLMVKSGCDSNHTITISTTNIHIRKHDGQILRSLKLYTQILRVIGIGERSNRDYINHFFNIYSLIKDTEHGSHIEASDVMTGVPSVPILSKKE